MAQEKPSYTAEGVALMRAVGAMEKDERVRNPDDLAVKFLGFKFRLTTRFPPLTWLALRTFQKKVPGGYYFHIARTKQMDEILSREIDQGLEQLVILGAGYDSRPYRFKDRLTGVGVFELDQPGTQTRKKERLVKMFGALPAHVTFVPMDFNSERLEVRLPEGGYTPEKKTLFIWEGVCMYVTPEAVDELLSFVCDRSPAGSSIVFDYMYLSSLDGRSDHYGARESVALVAGRGEPYIFGIEEGSAEQFLDARGFSVASLSTPSDLENAHLIRQDGSLHGRVYGYTDVVHAVVKAGS